MPLSPEEQAQLDALIAKQSEPAEVADAAEVSAAVADATGDAAAAVGEAVAEAVADVAQTVAVVVADAVADDGTAAAVAELAEQVDDAQMIASAAIDIALDTAVAVEQPAPAVVVDDAEPVVELPTDAPVATPDVAPGGDGAPAAAGGDKPHWYDRPIFGGRR